MTKITFFALIFVGFNLYGLELYLLPQEQVCPQCGFIAVTKKSLDALGIVSVRGASRLNIPVFEVIVNEKVVCNAFRINNNSWVTAAHCVRGEFSLRDDKTTFRNLKYSPHPLYDGNDADIALLTTKDNEFASLLGEEKFTFDSSSVPTEQAIIVTHSRVERVLYFDKCQNLFAGRSIFPGIKGSCVLPLRKDGLEIVDSGDSGSPVFKVIEKNRNFEYFFVGIIYKYRPEAGLVYHSRDFYFQNIFSSAYAIDYTTFILILMSFRI